MVVYQVLYGDYSSLEKSTIMARINQETSIYYLDETHRVGSLFESIHRRYSSIDQIPAHMQNAIIAAEDKNFYSHIGVDPVATLGAVVEGIMAGGRFRRGGSSLTQQTVKNIVDDWENSFARKFREMIKALQLERLYDKKQILEFYLNQFHVAGNGNGVGIAARYYFNKDVEDINLVEAAFIAGSVKGPSKYNPFIKNTRKSRERAIQYAFERKNYVLKRMFDEGWISPSEYEEAKLEPVPFNKGEFRTSEVALINLVKKQLRKNEVLDALNLESDKDLNIAGLKVYTTIDREVQNAAQLATRRNLSRLETILSGFAPEPEDKYKLLRRLELNEFYYGKVAAIRGDSPANYEIELSFGLPRGVIRNDSLKRYAKLLDLPVGHKSGYKHHLGKLVKTLKEGDVLFVEVTEYDDQTHSAVLELRKRPEISGGVIAIDKGEVRAVVSGFETLGFNRAIQAKRQPGSVFKTPTFLAALQMGWGLLDPIKNDRHVFSYQGKFYYPRPDHNSPYNSTSMLWTGIQSENIASVYLAANLLKHLSFGQFKQLLEEMNLAPLPSEKPRDYHYRVARKVGVQLNSHGVEKFQLRAAIEDLRTDLIFDGKLDLTNYLESTWWGDGYEDEIQSIYGYEAKAYSRREIRTRLELIRNNIIRHKKLAELLSEDWDKIDRKVKELGAETAFELPELIEAFDRLRVIQKDGKPNLSFHTVFVEELPPEEKTPLVSFDKQITPGRKLNVLDVEAIWGDSGIFGGSSIGISIADVMLDGFLPVSTLTRLEELIQAKVDEIKSSSGKYALRQYFQHHDFRIGLGLEYLASLLKIMGVESRLDPVLSFPLGTNVVTAAEVAKVYQTFLEGKAYAFYKSDVVNQINFIRRIEDRHGKILFEPKIVERQIVSKEDAEQVGEILRKIVTHGTGRRARGELYVDLSEKDQSGKIVKEGPKIRIPAFGKTGTTNEFTTSYFAGFMPYPTEESPELNFGNAYTVATYVGYDQPQRMERGRIKVYGGVGALPLWTDVLKEVITIKDYAKYIDQFDLSLLSKKQWDISRNPDEARQVSVDLPRGTVLSKSRIGRETYATTDLSTTGEEFQNEYAIEKSVKSTVWIPGGERSGYEVVPRNFTPVTDNHIKRLDAGDAAKVFLESEAGDAGPGEGGMRNEIESEQRGNFSPSQADIESDEGPDPTQNYDLDDPPYVESGTTGGTSTSVPKSSLPGSEKAYKEGGVGGDSLSIDPAGKRIKKLRNRAEGSGTDKKASDSAPPTKMPELEVEEPTSEEDDDLW